jgi:hypothetical protein
VMDDWARAGAPKQAAITPANTRTLMLSPCFIGLIVGAIKTNVRANRRPSNMTLLADPVQQGARAPRTRLR